MITEALKSIEPEVEAKRAALSVSLKTKVYAFVVDVSNDFPQEPVAVCYLSEPHRIIKMQAIDALDQSSTMAGDIILKSCLLPESDPRVLKEGSEYDTLYLTMISHARGLVVYYSNVLKKN